MALPLSAIYQSFRLIIIAGFASVILTLYSYFYFQDEIFPNVVRTDVIYLVLFGIFITAFLVTFVHRIRKANTELQDIAFRDSLTGAANRLLLKEKFQLLKDLKTPSIALLFIDMNGFKRINDTYGHEVGDYVLENVAWRVNNLLRDSDLLCRLGGDEFVILLSNIDHQVPERIADRIKLALENPMEMNDQMIEVSANIGWTYTTNVSDADLEKMLKEADRAMYRSKCASRILDV
ncbi:GGDEF domain-containing protein [Paucisalibacillus globulus]|uniref:GGDEF domain-containing protein n=1 Tax=Paucisalibacillus globulus TaxID=351095 RepID=UPI001FE08EDB|nr:GGDEF domain-containing protein [Paucisalibacillus globulus]